MPSFGVRMKTDRVPSCGQCCFPNLLASWVHHFHSIIFLVWNPSAEIPPPPLALFVVMLSKAHWTLHSKLSGYRWVIWVIKSFFFFFSSPVYSFHLFLISSTSVRSILFLTFIVPIFIWKFPLVSLIFLKRSLVFPILFFSSMSLYWSLRKAFLPSLLFFEIAFRWVYLSFSLVFRFSSFLSYL